MKDSLQYNQIENILVKHNQALNGLNNIKVWWASVGENERNDEKNMDKLVTSTEKILLSEHQAWIQNMKQAVSINRYYYIKRLL
jgi:conflict system pore-forming effector with SLATT domain